MVRTSLSIVIPVYNEARALPELELRLLQTLPTLGFESVEVLLVSDGSTDGSNEHIRELAARDRRFRGVMLSRNFGHQAAISTGIDLARGDAVAVMDADLQDPPEVLTDLLQALDAGADVAYGVRRRRKEGIFKRGAYATFYRILRSISSVPIPLHSGDFCVMRSEVVDALRKLPEATRFVRGLRAWVGFRQVGIEYERHARFADKPRYTLGQLVQLAYDGLFSFSTLPIRVIQLLGFLVSSVALVVAVYYLIWSLAEPERFPQGFATITISIWLLSGIQLLFLGIVGEYVARGVTETRRVHVDDVDRRVGSPV